MAGSVLHCTTKWPLSYCCVLSLPALSLPPPPTHLHSSIFLAGWTNPLPVRSDLQINIHRLSAVCHPQWENDAMHRAKSSLSHMIIIIIPANAEQMSFMFCRSPQLMQASKYYICQSIWILFYNVCQTQMKKGVQLGVQRGQLADKRSIRPSSPTHSGAGDMGNVLRYFHMFNVHTQTHSLSRSKQLIELKWRHRSPSTPPELHSYRQQDAREIEPPQGFITSHMEICFDARLPGIIRICHLL